jgi:hypothetical protein
VSRARAYPPARARSVYENMLAAGFSNVSKETLAAKPPAAGSGGAGACGGLPSIAAGSGESRDGGLRAPPVAEAKGDVGPLPDGGDVVGVPGRLGCLSAERRGGSRGGSAMNEGGSAIGLQGRDVIGYRS